MTPKEEARIERRRAVIAAAQVQRLVDRKPVSLAEPTIWRKIVAEREPQEEAAPPMQDDLRDRLWGINK